MKQPDDPLPDSTPKFSRLVRALAVAYVLSIVLQPAGFVIFGAAAIVVYGFKHEVNAWVIGLSTAAVAFAVLCPAFRWWFRRWGRKHYPEPKEDLRSSESE